MDAIKAGFPPDEIDKAFVDKEGNQRFITKSGVVKTPLDPTTKQPFQAPQQYGAISGGIYNTAQGPKSWQSVGDKAAEDQAYDAALEQTKTRMEPDGDPLKAYAMLEQTKQKATKPEAMTMTELYLKAANGDPVAQKAVRLAKPGPQVVNLAGTTSTGEANPMVKAIANYDMALPASRSSSPASINAQMQLVKAVKDINPQWDALTFPNALKTLEAFGSGREANSVGAINTAAGHLNSLAQAAKALGGGNLKVLNAISNAYGGQTGNDALSVYRTILHRIGPEITRAYIGTGGDIQDRVANESDFDPSLGTNVILKNIGSSANLFQSKINALKNQFEKNVKGGAHTFNDYVTPEAQAVFGSFGPRKAAAAPAIGTVMDGHRFNGGDPSNPANWTPVAR
jgi:hypothetical protein